ncbi:6-bladed beta-propeller [Gemmatimonadota bacterium]
MLSACGRQGTPEAEFYVGSLQSQIETTDEGTLVTVQQGSVWGEAVELEILTHLGTGREEHDILVNPHAIAVDVAGQRLFVADSRPVVQVRVYDFNGNFINNIGGNGDGPGEYRQPTGVAFIAPQQRLIVYDIGKRALSYTADGEYLTYTPLPRAERFPQRFVLVKNEWGYFDHTVSEGSLQNNSSFRRTRAFLGVNLTTAEIDTMLRPSGYGETVLLQSGTSPLPFGAWFVWAIGPDGSTVAGYGDDYSFDIRKPDGTLVSVQMPGIETPVIDKEREWWTRRTEVALESDAAAWRRSGPPVPKTKPAFIDFFIDSDGRIWITRQGVGRKIPGGARGFDDRQEVLKNPCWYSTLILDVFENDGTYLGRIDLPKKWEFFQIDYAEGDLVAARASGTDQEPFAFLYRLETP